MKLRYMSNYYFTIELNKFFINKNDSPVMYLKNYYKAILKQKNVLDYKVYDEFFKIHSYMEKLEYIKEKIFSFENELKIELFKNKLIKISINNISYTSLLEILSNNKIYNFFISDFNYITEEEKKELIFLLATKKIEIPEIVLKKYIVDNDEAEKKNRLHCFEADYGSWEINGIESNDFVIEYNKILIEEKELLLKLEKLNKNLENEEKFIEIQKLNIEKNKLEKKDKVIIEIKKKEIKEKIVDSEKITVKTIVPFYTIDWSKNIVSNKDVFIYNDDAKTSVYIDKCIPLYTQINKNDNINKNIYPEAFVSNNILLSNNKGILNMNNVDFTSDDIKFINTIDKVDNKKIIDKTNNKFYQYYGMCLGININNIWAEKNIYKSLILSKKLNKEEEKIFLLGYQQSIPKIIKFRLKDEYKDSIFGESKNFKIMYNGKTIKKIDLQFNDDELEKCFSIFTFLSDVFKNNRIENNDKIFKIATIIPNFLGDRDTQLINYVEFKYKIINNIMLIDILDNKNIDIKEFKIDVKEIFYDDSTLLNDDLIIYKNILFNYNFIKKDIFHSIITFIQFNLNNIIKIDYIDTALAFYSIYYEDIKKQLNLNNLEYILITVKSENKKIQINIFKNEDELKIKSYSNNQTKFEDKILNIVIDKKDGTGDIEKNYYKNNMEIIYNNYGNYIDDVLKGMYKYYNEKKFYEEIQNE